MSRALILVPARYGSTRFPGKPLAPIKNRPMISYVMNNCEKSGFDYAIVTDDDRIESAVKELGGAAVRVDDPVETGSERIYLAYTRYFADKNYEFVVNLQGDEPLMGADSLKKIVDNHAQSDFDIYTAVKSRQDLAMHQNPNVVKAVLSPLNNQCLYFSRAQVPFMRSRETKWYQHIGIYSYRSEALERFAKFDQSELEITESLEQLRALENGMTIGAVELEMELFGVDTPEDIAKIEGVLK